VQGYGVVFDVGIGLGGKALNSGFDEGSVVLDCYDDGEFQL
jgi:hypothetical protein